jgi:hypothetical protein
MDKYRQKVWFIQKENSDRCTKKEGRMAATLPGFVFDDLF